MSSFADALQERIDQQLREQYAAGRLEGGTVEREAIIAWIKRMYGTAVFVDEIAAGIRAGHHRRLATTRT